MEQCSGIPSTTEWLIYGTIRMLLETAMKIEIVRTNDELIILDGCGNIIGTVHWLYDISRERIDDVMPHDVQIMISRALRFID